MTFLLGRSICASTLILIVLTGDSHLNLALVIVVFVTIGKVVLDEGASPLTDTVMRGDDAAESFMTMSMGVPTIAGRVRGTGTIDAVGYKYPVETGGMTVIMIPSHREPPCTSVGEMQSVHHG